MTYNGQVLPILVFLLQISTQDGIPSFPEEDNNRTDALWEFHIAAAARDGRERKGGGVSERLSVKVPAMYSSV